MSDLTSLLYGWLHFGVMIILMIVAVARKRDPSSALGWCLVIAFIPIVGPLAFLIFGLTRIPRRLSRTIAHREKLSSPLGPLEAPHEISARLSPGEIATTLGGAPKRSGNSVEIFNRGIDTYAEILRVLESAEHHIHIQFFIFRRDKVGRRLLKVLEEKAKSGVEVRLLIDGIGMLTGWRIIREVRRAGGKATAFLPLLIQGRYISPNLRNHRKLIICDGRSAFIGGFNVGEEYLGKEGNRRPWFDLHFKIEGPSVIDLQETFVLDWSFCTDEELKGASYFPANITPSGDVALRVVAGGPDTNPNPIREAVFAAISRSNKQVTIATPYLVPDLGLLDALRLAARGGVAVDIVIQSEPTDHPVVYWCSLYYAEQLTQAGARIHEYKPGMMHAKAVIVDDDFAMIGTANLDRRSLSLNFELVALIDEPASTLPFRRQVETLVQESSLLTMDRFIKRSIISKAAISLARLLAPIL
ncbi:MAG: cardiolipin synthase [Planctomycetota bacterium]|jgi:cardiolipin synthase